MNEPISRAEVQVNYDAQLVGVLVRESAKFIREAADFRGWEHLQNVGGRHGVEAEASRAILSELRVEQTPFSLLFGRNGTGKSRLLGALSDIPTGKRSLLNAALKFRYPSEADEAEWREAVEAAKSADWVEAEARSTILDEYFEDHADDQISAVLERIYQRPFVDLLYQSLMRDPSVSGPEFFGLDQKDQLEVLGFSMSSVEGWESREAHRWGPNRVLNDSGHSVPYDFMSQPSVREMAAEYYFHYASGMPWNIHRGPSDSYGRGWTSTSDWVETPELAGLIGPAVEEFMANFTHVEMVHSGKIRMLVDPDSVPAVMRYIKAASNYMKDQVSQFGVEFVLEKSLPLDMFRMQSGGGMVESALLDFGSMGDQKIVEVVDLTFDQPTGDQMADLVERLSSRHLEMRLSVDAVDRDSMGLFISGYESLRRVGAEVSERLRRCEAGIQEVRISGFVRDRTKWFTESRTGNPQIFHYAAGDVFAAIPRPTIEWKDVYSDAWLSFDDASLGQKQLMATMFAVELIADRSKSPLVTVVVGDEIDRNLHWRAASRMLEELNERLSAIAGVWVLFSTHSVPALGSARMSGIDRILSDRVGADFSFVQSANLRELDVAEVLGVNPVDTLRFADLLLVVEGDHDELILRNKFLDGHPMTNRVHIVNGGGLYAWNGILSNALQHLDAPVLFVHDKRNVELEANWDRVRDGVERGIALPSWNQAGFYSMLSTIKDRRRDHKRVPGDDESEKLLWMLKNNVFEPTIPGLSRPQPNAKLARRLYLHGIDADDIVDLLPIKYFPKAAAAHKNWEEAHQSAPNGSVFKDKFGIDGGTISKALSKDQGNLHPELNRLLGRINMLLPE